MDIANPFTTARVGIAAAARASSFAPQAGSFRALGLQASVQARRIIVIERAIDERSRP
jgi:hypothetical protein